MGDMLFYLLPNASLILHYFVLQVLRSRFYFPDASSNDFSDAE